MILKYNFLDFAFYKFWAFSLLLQAMISINYRTLIVFCLHQSGKVKQNTKKDLWLLLNKQLSCLVSTRILFTCVSRLEYAGFKFPYFCS